MAQNCLNNNKKNMLKVKFEKLDAMTLLKKILPKLTKCKAKGDNGIIGVIGGSLEYTGAPYYGAISSLYAGSDLAHVFCHVDAVVPIKCYSPELIVHPAFDSKSNEELLTKTAKWVNNMNSVLVGPGLGREDYTYSNMKFLLKSSLLNKGKIRFIIKDLVHVFDADSMWHFMKEPGQFCMEDNHVIFTPNKNEFERLYNKFIKESNLFDNYSSLYQETDEIFYSDLPDIMSMFEKEVQLAEKLGNKIIVKKVYLCIK
jgi:ATP-dependent NAD(P)H-hydrate dehydratase